MNVLWALVYVTIWISSAVATILNGTPEIMMSPVFGTVIVAVTHYWIENMK